MMGVLLLLWSAIAAASNLEVKKIHFAGNQAIPAGELRSIIKMKEGKPFNIRFLKLDEILMANFYRLRGFVEVQVSGEFRKEGDHIFVTYRIQEGPRYLLKRIQFAGNEIIGGNALRSFFPIRDGYPFDRTLIEEGLNRVENYYLDHGKPYVILTPQEEAVPGLVLEAAVPDSLQKAGFPDSLVEKLRPFTEVELEEPVVKDTLAKLFGGRHPEVMREVLRRFVRRHMLMSVMVYIVEGETVRIEKIQFEGATAVKQSLIRRQLTIHSGDLYSRKRIEESQRNLYGTGLFKFVTYRLETVEGDQTRARLIWQLEEKKARWAGVRFGIGLERGESVADLTTFDVTLEGGHRNLLGTARSLSLGVISSLYYGRIRAGKPRRFSNPRNQYSLNFVEPYLFNSRTPLRLNVTYSQERPPIAPAKLNIFSASLNITHEFNPVWSLRGTVSFQKVSTPSREVLNRVAEGKDLIYALTIIPARDSRDNILVPRRGSLTETRHRFVYAASRVGGDGQTLTNAFYKITAAWHRYQKFALNKRWFLATRLRGGAIIEFGGRRPIESIPLTERFFMGGASTVRGYAEQSIGGKDEQGVPLGGKFSLVANAELRIPLFWLVWGEVFLDAGNIWQELEDLRAPALKLGSGAGLAFITPFGPLRFDYGFRLFPPRGRAGGDFHLGLSFAF